MRPITVVLASIFALLPFSTFAQTAPPPAPKPPQTAKNTPSLRAFVDDDLNSQVIRLEERIKKQNPNAVGQSADNFKRDATQALVKNDARRALILARNAVAANPSDAQNWLLMARAAFTITDPKDYGEKYSLQEAATVASYGAYIKAQLPADQGTALAQLGATYERREYWRQSLNAYRASLELLDAPAVRVTYDNLREKYGFRIKDYKVDADAASPRACFQFSENLLRSKSDFSSFVAVSGKQTGTSITTENSQICVEGLKHGERYAIVIRQGLPSDIGENLLKSADYEIYVQDRAPSVRFTGRNYVLPKIGQQGLPVVTVNTAKVDLEIHRIGDRSLVPALRSDGFLDQMSGSNATSIATEKGQKIWSGSLDTKNELNQEVITAFPIADAIKDMQPGVYIMFGNTPNKASSADSDGDDYYNTRATQWFVVSDLGLTSFSGDDGVHVLVRSLASSNPVSDVEVRLIAKNNEVLATKTADKTGYVRFEPGLSRGSDGLAPAVITVSDNKGDYGFLDLTQTSFDLSDRGVKGRVAPGPLDAFIYTERGVYRSGETVNSTALLRDAAGNAVQNLALTGVVTRPDGVEYKRQIVQDQGSGGRTLAIPLLSSAQSGTWRVVFYADPKGASIGSTTFLVEDYMPERMELELKSTKPFLRNGEPLSIAATASYLYGAAATNLDITGDFRLEAASEIALPALKGYEVGLTDEPFEAVTGELEAGSSTDNRGKATVSIPLPETTASRALQANVTMRISESGGRAISRSVIVPIVPKGTLIGVKQLFENEKLSDGGKADFEAIIVNGEGKRIARPNVKWVLNRIDRNYQWFFKNGRWNYEATKITRAVADGSADLSETSATKISAPVKLGSYRLDVRADGLAGVETSVSFAVGWDGERTANTPDVLDMTLDKASYAAGDTMKLRLDPRFGVKATIAVISDKLQTIEMIDVPATGGETSLTVKPEWGAGAYVIALAHRPLDAAAQRAPSRSIGVAWFAIERSTRMLNVELTPPKIMQPRAKLIVPVKLAGLKTGDEAFVTVSAVDVGILSLTKFESPNPSKYYFGQRQLGLELRDLYGFLIDGMQGTRGAIRSGGDAAAATTQGTPPVFEPLSRYSGVVKVGADGTAMIEFDVPAFNGTVRVMAVAWSKGQIGEAQADVVIRDSIVVTPTLPRFVNMGDETRLHLSFDNVEAPPGDYMVEVTPHGPIKIAPESARASLKLIKGQKVSLSVPVTALGLGAASLDVRLKGISIEGKTFELALTQNLRVQVPNRALVRRSVQPLVSNATLTVSRDLLGDMVAGSGQVSVSISPFTALDVPALLAQLDRYPYGCTEQTISRAMPLLYVNRLEAQQRFALDLNADERIKGAIDRVMARQSSNGSFGLWGIGGTDLWLDAFTVDFLTRAGEKGFVIPQKGMMIALDHLRNGVVNTSSLTPETASGVAYAIYVLARNGRPIMGDLRYMADTKLSEFTSPLAKAQIAAALGLLGDKGRSGTAFQASLDALDKAQDDGYSRYDYGSKLRDGAGIISLLADAKADRVDIQRASFNIEKARDTTKYTSTQEQGWMVLAAQSLAKDADKQALLVDGVPATGAFYRTVTQANLDEKLISIVNTGATSVRAVISVSGVPITPEPAAEQGFKIERSFYSMKGAPIDMTKIRQNDRFIVSLKITEKEARFGRLLIVDPLPAGLEIDNPNLVEGTVLPDAEWLKREVQPETTEYRDDRFMAAFERSTSQKAVFSIAYVVRAVSPGRYVQPGAVIEDMYRPERYGRTQSGTLDIAAK
jgi:alpha-2-macroglobulin